MSVSFEEISGQEVPSHRACAHCRSQKVRCIVDDDNTDVCQRCARSGRPCVFTPLQKRKQRKRTDTRVAELEREMRAMRAMLKNKGQPGRPDVVPKDPGDGRIAGLWYKENKTDGEIHVTDGETGPPSFNREMSKEQDGQTYWPSRFQDRPLSEIRDVIDNGVISMDTGRRLFETYRNDLFPHYPMVPIPKSTTAEEFRKAKPTLFLAIIAAAAGKGHPDLSAMLDQEVLHAYATRMFIRSEKSLELIQALMISAAWYHPPQKFGQLKYYEYVRMAATMALDIGIAVRSVPRRPRFGKNPVDEERNATLHPLEDKTNPDLSMTPRSRDTSPDPASVESRRTYLACYAIHAGISLSVRRPNMFRVTSYVRECLEYLEQSPDTLPSDRGLVAWAKLIMIAEEISTSFSYDDPGGIASISDLRSQLIMRDLANRLDKWYSSIPDVDMISSLQISYWTVRLYCHELALHVDHSSEDFKAPYQMGVIHPWDGEDVPAQVLAPAIAECITCAHNVLNAFLSMDVEATRALPVVSFVRLSFAAFVITKLCVSASHPKSRIGRVLDRSALKAESFMDRAILHIQAILTPVRCRVPAIFLALLFKLRAWCMNPKMLDQSADKRVIAINESVENELRSQEKAKSQRPRQASGSGLRTVQQGSDEETSPETSSGSQIDERRVQSEASSSVHYGPTPPSQFADTYGVNTNNQYPTLGMMPSITAHSGIDMMQPTSYMHSHDHMEMDQNFLQAFGDVNPLATDGLTGLDDWTGLPVDFMSMPQNFDWQSGGNSRY